MTNSNQLASIVLIAACAGCGSSSGGGPPHPGGGGSGGTSSGGTSSGGTSSGGTSSGGTSSGGTSSGGTSSGGTSSGGTSSGGTSSGGAAGAGGSSGFGGFPGGPCPNDMQLDAATYSPTQQSSGGSVKVTMKVLAGSPTSACEVKYWINCQVNQTTPTWSTLSLVAGQFEGMVPVDCTGEPQAAPCSYSMYFNFQNGITHSDGGYPGPVCVP